ncbi:MAG: GLPGLI family protein [Pelobium sp.]
MKNLLLTIFVISSGMNNIALCQFSHFTNHGVIEYEKTVNMFALLKPTDADNTFQKMFYDKYKETKPQFQVLKSKLIFDTQKSLFTPVWEDNDKVNAGGWGGSNIGPQINQVFTDLTTSNFTTKKKVFEEDFIVKDSVRKIDWKITSEVREIAGYNCRRANALIMDSVYVVAFYTDEIPVSGGPESFTGLPGMILGVALPNEHITWFATKITDVPVADKEFVVPDNKKTKPINIKELKAKISGIDEYFQKTLKSFLL